MTCLFFVGESTIRTHIETETHTDEEYNNSENIGYLPMEPQKIYILNIITYFCGLMTKNTKTI